MIPFLPLGAIPADPGASLLNLEDKKSPEPGRLRWKITILLLAIAVIVALTWYVLIRDDTSIKDTSEQVHTAADALLQSADDADDVVDLAIKTISLSQGEGGFELWRLKAEWANMRRSDDLIIVEQPRLTYNMREEGQVLYVQSRTGDIYQKDQILRFIDDVHVTQENKIITSSLLVYNGNEKTMTFPQGCQFIDTGVAGSADTLVWHIDSQRIVGEGNIDVLLEGSSTVVLPESQQVEDSENTPASLKERP